jgi:hypothetical protein
MENANILLAAWLKNEGRKVCWLAKQIGAGRGAVGRWRNGDATPLPIYRAEIERITGGAVPADAWK